MRTHRTRNPGANAGALRSPGFRVALRASGMTTRDARTFSATRLRVRVAPISIPQAGGGARGLRQGSCLNFSAAQGSFGERCASPRAPFTLVFPGLGPRSCTSPFSGSPPGRWIGSASAFAPRYPFRLQPPSTTSALGLSSMPCSPVPCAGCSTIPDVAVSLPATRSRTKRVPESQSSELFETLPCQDGLIIAQLRKGRIDFFVALDCAG